MLLKRNLTSGRGGWHNRVTLVAPRGVRCRGLGIVAAEKIKRIVCVTNSTVTNYPVNWW